MSRVHVIGAGLAGIACGLRLNRAGIPCSIYEATAQAGGRCRSYFDERLDRRIDNGNHLLLGANRAALDYVTTIGTRDRFVSPARAIFPFVDLRSGDSWALRPGTGVLPWWILDRRRRVPGSSVIDYLQGLNLALAGRHQNVADCLSSEGVLWQRFWRPLCAAALNTAPEEASARLLWKVISETFAKGEAACRPLVPKVGLSDSLIDPALDRLRAAECSAHFNRRLRSFDFTGNRVSNLNFGDSQVRLDPADLVVLAVPPGHAGQLVPGLKVPDDSRPIVNVHLRLGNEAPAPSLLPPELPFLGLIGGAFDWVFVRGDVASLTVSAAADLASQSAERIAQQAWTETAQALRLDSATPHRVRVVKERRATFAQTPEALALRPAARTHWANLFLAGDWTDTGYPATIESAIRSGNTAAGLALAQQ